MEVHFSQESHITDASWNLASYEVVVQIEVLDVLHLADTCWKVSDEPSEASLQILEVLEVADAWSDSARHRVVVKVQALQKGHAFYLVWKLAS